MRIADQIDEETFARKQTELRDSMASIKLQIDAVDRSRDEIGDLAMKVFDPKKQNRVANTAAAMGYRRLRGKTSNPRNRLFAVSISGAASTAQLPQGKH